MSKLYRARSLLYRRQILQENIRWKALDEIYKIYMFLHRLDINISAKLCQFFFAFFDIEKTLFFNILIELLKYAQILMKFSRNFAKQIIKPNPQAEYSRTC